jgi:hypothetical protein
VLLPKAPLAPSVIVAGLLPSGGRRSALDVFLSYATEDRLKAASLVKLFEEAGWEVWWDRAIGPGEEWEPAVLEHLRRARCVVVLWSRASVGKAWVRREAAEAEANGTLVPVLLQPAGLPNPTPRIQALRLATWDGAGTSELQELLEAVRARVGHGIVPDLADPAHQGRAREHLDRIERLEVAEAAFAFCAVSLEHDRRRRLGHAFTPEELTDARDAYDRLKVLLSSRDVPFHDEDMHDLLARFMNLLHPPG